MKKLIALLSIFALMSTAMLSLTAPCYADGTKTEVLAADTSSPGGTNLPWDGSSLPSTWGMVAGIFATLAGYIGLTMVVSGWLLSRWKMNSTFKQVLTWAVALGLGYLAKYFGWGIFSGINFGYAALLSIGVGCVANKYFNSGVLDNILVFVGSLPAKVRDARKAGS